MPFDGSRFDPPPPEPPRRDPKAGEGAFLWTIATLAVLTMLLPISADGLIDLVEWLGSHLPAL